MKTHQNVVLEVLKYISKNIKIQKILDNSTDIEIINLMIGLIKKQYGEDAYLKLKLYYSGQGDSGEDFFLEEVITSINDINDAELNKLINWWDLEYLINYDWVNNEGGYGFITLDILNNSYEIEGYVRICNADLIQSNSYKIFE